MGVKIMVGNVEVGEVTDFRAAPSTTGPVYEIKAVTPSDVTPSKVTIPTVNSKPNRAQLRTQKKR